MFIPPWIVVIPVGNVYFTPSPSAFSWSNFVVCVWSEPWLVPAVTTSFLFICILLDFAITLPTWPRVIGLSLEIIDILPSRLSDEKYGPGFAKSVL